MAGGGVSKQCGQTRPANIQTNRPIRYQGPVQVRTVLYCCTVLYTTLWKRAENKLIVGHRPPTLSAALLAVSVYSRLTNKTRKKERINAEANINTLAHFEHGTRKELEFNLVVQTKTSSPSWHLIKGHHQYQVCALGRCSCQFHQHLMLYYCPLSDDDVGVSIV